jgi:hypothetical protein
MLFFYGTRINPLKSIFSPHRKSPEKKETAGIETVIFSQFNST